MFFEKKCESKTVVGEAWACTALGAAAPATSFLIVTRRRHPPPPAREAHTLRVQHPGRNGDVSLTMTFYNGTVGGGAVNGFER